jgi:L-ascorbate metabolism protein UlaG (beta-lactamase superfamily)
MMLCHLGDFGEEKLSDEQLDAIGDIDILMVPVGGVSTLNAKEAVEVVSQIEPKIVIPMHYKVAGSSMTDIDGVEKFVKEISLTPEKVDKLRMVKKSLPVEETKLVLFEL